MRRCFDFSWSSRCRISDQTDPPFEMEIPLSLAWGPGDMNYQVCLQISDQEPDTGSILYWNPSRSYDHSDAFSDTVSLWFDLVHNAFLPDGNKITEILVIFPWETPWPNLESIVQWLRSAYHNADTILISDIAGDLIALTNELHDQPSTLNLRQSVNPTIFFTHNRIYLADLDILSDSRSNKIAKLNSLLNIPLSIQKIKQRKTDITSFFHSKMNLNQSMVWNHVVMTDDEDYRRKLSLIEQSHVIPMAEPDSTDKLEITRISPYYDHHLFHWNHDAHYSAIGLPELGISICFGDGPRIPLCPSMNGKKSFKRRLVMEGLPSHTMRWEILLTVSDHGDSPGMIVRTGELPQWMQENQIEMMCDLDGDNMIAINLFLPSQDKQIPLIKEELAGDLLMFYTHNNPGN